MVASTLLENILVKTDSLLERIFHNPQDQEPVSFRRYLTDPRKILFVPGENLTELVLGLTFVSPTLEKFPRAEISILVNPELACLLDNVERVNVITCGHRSPHSFDPGLRKMFSQLQEENFDLAVNLSCSGRSDALLTYNSGAKIRTGLPLPDNEKYYNLIVKNIPPQGSFTRRFACLFRALQVEGPFEPPGTVIQFTRQEHLRAEQFLRRRKSSRDDGDFIGCILEWDSSQKKMEQLLHTLLEELINELDPFHLLIAGDRMPSPVLQKYSSLTASTHLFNDLRQMLAVLAACDKVITNCVGFACLLARLGTRVGLFPTEPEHISHLGESNLENIQILQGDKGEFPLKQALSFTHQSKHKTG